MFELEDIIERAGERVASEYTMPGYDDHDYLKEVVREHVTNAIIHVLESLRVTTQMNSFRCVEECTIKYYIKQLQDQRDK